MLLFFRMSNSLVIKGGKPLFGNIRVMGSKNTATKLMVASLLTDEPCRIENIPFSMDTDITKELCENIGSKVEFDENHVCKIETNSIKTSRIPELSRRNRIPILAIGPLLHRTGFAEVPILGGCPIGHRPVNFHMEALNKMGIKIERREHSYFAEADRIVGAEIEFPFPSVGATENSILTAVLAKGKTIIKNAAVEPEVINLVEMLGNMGAKINCNLESRTVEIEGVVKLKGVKIATMPDRNEIVSFAAAAASTEGEIFIENIIPDTIQSFLQSFADIGGQYKIVDSGIKFWGKKPYTSIFIQTSCHPGFMTDWQQPFCVLLTQAQGISMIHETVYEDRFGYVKDLRKMGANITVLDECPEGKTCRFSGQTYNHTAKIVGLSGLIGSKIKVTDVRAGMAHLIAALTAKGESLIDGVWHLDRGYERIDERLKELGADIQRVKS